MSYHAGAEVSYGLCLKVHFNSVLFWYTSDENVHFSINSKLSVTSIQELHQNESEYYYVEVYISVE